MRNTLRKLSRFGAVLGLGFAVMALPSRSAAQDQDDPPGRVGRIGYLQGSVSFLPAGETEWVGAVPNRPMTTGDRLWTDQDARAEVQIGSAVIRLAPNTGFSFLNLDDNTVQVQLSSGAINATVRRLDDNDDFEVDTPNQAFTALRPGHYRVEASPDGNSTVITVRDGGGEATGYGQTYTLRPGERGTFSGTDSLYANVEPIGGPDDFDRWSEGRDHRYDSSRSAQYLSRDVVGFDDLDDYGDWRDDPNYGHVWYPNQVGAGWAPYRDGHWDWVEPWGWTWVDDSPWGYAPFHYGRWVSAGGRWGWVAGPEAVRPVYAPALVVFVGGGGGFGGNVGWFPLGPREVYVPSYRVSQGYVNRVNVSNTTVNVTQVTNVYNTTIVHNTTNITNVTYVNRNVQGAVTAVPQRTFVSAQPVAKAAVPMNARDIAAAPVSARVAVAPTQASVLGARAATANHVAAPPPAIENRQVVAKKTPPPPPVPFARQQQALAAHPGQPLGRSEVQSLRPTASAAARPMVKVAPPGKPATPTAGRPGTQPMNQPAANQPAAVRPGVNQPGVNQQTNRPGNAPVANQPGANQQTNRPMNQPPANGNSATENRTLPASPQNIRPGVPRPPQPNQPPAAQPNYRPQPAPAENRPEPTPRAPQPPAAQPNYRPQPAENRPEPTPRAPQPPVAQPNYRPQPAPAENRPEPTPRAPQPPAAQPNYRPQPAPAENRPEPTPRAPQPPAAQPNYRPQPAPAENRPEPNRNEQAPRSAPPPAERPQERAVPAPPKPAQPPTPEQKKQEDQRRKDEKPPGD